MSKSTNWSWAEITAAVMPFLISVFLVWYGLISFGFKVSSHFIQQMSVIWFLIIVLATVISAAILTVLVLLSKGWNRLSVMPFALIALGPWPAGLAGSAHGYYMVKKAAVMVAPEMVGRLFAAGTSIALMPVILGMVASGGLFLAMGIATALVTFGNRASVSSPGSYVAPFLAAPFVIAAIVVWVKLGMGVPLSGLLFPALAMPIVARLSSMGVGNEKTSAAVFAAPAFIFFSFISFSMAQRLGAKSALLNLCSSASNDQLNLIVAQGNLRHFDELIMVAAATAFLPVLVLFLQALSSATKQLRLIKTAGLLGLFSLVLLGAGMIWEVATTTILTKSVAQTNSAKQQDPSEKMILDVQVDDINDPTPNEMTPGSFHTDFQIPATNQRRGDIKITVENLSFGQRRVIDRKKNSLRYCYERVLREQPKLHGSIEFLIMISPVGTVLSVSTNKSTIGDPKVAQCCSRMFHRMKFPVIDGPNAVGKIKIEFSLKK